MYASVNRVYQLVKDIADKQQHGFITPSQFNQVAYQAQLSVFDDLIEEFKNNTPAYLNRALPMNGMGGRHQTEDDLRTLYVYNSTLSYSSADNAFSYPDDYAYRIQLSYLNAPIDILTGQQSRRATNNYLIGGRACARHAVMNGSGITLVPDVSADVTLDYYKIPQGIDSSGEVSALGPTWASTTVGNIATYNAANSINFELPTSTEQRLAYKVLSMFGISLRDIELMQYSEAQEDKEIREQ